VVGWGLVCVLGVFVGGGGGGVGGGGGGGGGEEYMCVNVVWS